MVTILILGLAVSVLTGRKKNNTAATGWMNEFFEYNVERLVQSINISSGKGVPSITTRTWFNHKLISSSSCDIMLTYYADMLKQNVDYIILYQALFRSDGALTILPSRYIPCNINETSA